MKKPVGADLNEIKNDPRIKVEECGVPNPQYTDIVVYKSKQYKYF